MSVTVRRTAQAWEVKLTDPGEVALFGVQWIPLPLTSAASFEMVTAHLLTLPAYAGATVVVEG